MLHIDPKAHALPETQALLTLLNLSPNRPYYPLVYTQLQESHLATVDIIEIDIYQAAHLVSHLVSRGQRRGVRGVGLMEELVRHGYDIGPGTLYPTLGKLERGGFLTCEARTVDHKQRKYYRITPVGMSLLGF